MDTIQNQTLAHANPLELATLGGGCFWCVEAVFQDLKGVHKVVSGYTGGPHANPTYKEVCSGLSGHAEVIQVSFDPTVIAFADILRIFFTVHDPTTLNRQGNDVGTQYRSVIYYHDEAQKNTVQLVLPEAQEAWDAPIVTEVSPMGAFYLAEEYHQNYFKQNPNQGYCSFIIAPKVRKFREKYRELLAGA